MVAMRCRALRRPPGGSAERSAAAARDNLAAMSSAAPRSTDVEVEWQFDALDLRPAERWFAALSPPRAGEISTPSAVATVLSALTATPRAAERLVDTYFDTSDWRIGRSGHVLRVRHRGGRARGDPEGIGAVTGRACGDGWRSPSPCPWTASVPSGPRGRWAGGCAPWPASGPCKPILEVRTRRRPFDLAVSTQTVAEAALDETTIVVGHDHQPVRLQRVEVEVEPAWVEALHPRGRHPAA